MNKIDVYDFDGTLYSKDSSVQFYIYCIKRNKKIVKYIPGIILFYILYFLRIIKKEKLKEYFFLFLNDFDNINDIVSDFWRINKKFLRLDIIKKNQNNKVVISASPEFLIKDVCNEIGIDKVIASKVNKNNGKFESLNCYGIEKIHRLNSEFDNYRIMNIYSDSVSDINAFKEADKEYLLYDNKIHQLDDFKENMVKYVLNTITYIYLSIPIIIFLFGWVKTWLAIVLLIFLMISIIHRILKCKIFNIRIIDYIYKNRNAIMLTLIIAVLLVFMSGVCGNVFQNEDYIYRNSIFLDLINKKWPIYLSSGGDFYKEVIMVYYFALWLPAAVIGKVFGISGGFSALYLWCLIGVYITMRYLQLYYKKSLIIPIVLFICFSGLDIIEAFMYGEDILALINSTAHLEWTTGFQFSSFITQLFWVFNQAIPAWLLTLLILNEESTKRLLVLLAFSLIFSTLPTFGLLFAAIYKVYFSESEKICIKSLVKKTINIFSYENVLIGIPLAIVLGTFAMSNANSEFITIGVPIYTILAVIVTAIFEFLIYYYFAFKYCEDKKLIVLSLISLIICPFISINGGSDFCMRASIPGLIILLTLLLQTISKMDKKSLDFKVLLVILMFGAVTPLNEIKRTISNTNADIQMETTELISSPCQKNFYGYKDESLFVKYFAKSQ